MEDKNITPVTPNSWTNPSTVQNVDTGIKQVVKENTKEINELKQEVKELKEEISKLSGEETNSPKEEVSSAPKEETPVVEEPKVETPIDIPFAESPFTEAISKEEPVETPIVETPILEMPTETPIENTEEAPAKTELTNDMKDILNSVKEEIPVEEKPAEEIPSFEDMLVEDESDKLSIVVNRYNTDIVATTKGKGAKFITLTDSEHSKLLSGKIN